MVKLHPCELFSQLTESKRLRRPSEKAKTVAQRLKAKTSRRLWRLRGRMPKAWQWQVQKECSGCSTLAFCLATKFVNLLLQVSQLSGRRGGQGLKHRNNLISSEWREFSAPWQAKVHQRTCHKADWCCKHLSCAPSLLPCFTILHVQWFNIPAAEKLGTGKP